MKELKPDTYVRVVQLPYEQHRIAKEILHSLREHPKTKVKRKRQEFGKTKKRIIRGLFKFTMTQMAWYCPADKLTLDIGEKNVTISYEPNRQYYKGVEEL